MGTLKLTILIVGSLRQLFCIITNKSCLCKAFLVFKINFKKLLRMIIIYDKIIKMKLVIIMEQEIYIIKSIYMESDRCCQLPTIKIVSLRVPING